MGNQNGGPVLHGEAKLAAAKFDPDEIHVLNKTWQDLADRSNGKGIDKDTFLQYFPLNGLLGDRLFAQFDTKSSGSIDFDEFVTGLATVCRGSLDDKIHFIFDMYDVSHDKSVSKQELATLLNQVPKEMFDSTPIRQIHRSGSHSGLSDPDHADDSSNPDGDAVDEIMEEVDTYTNHDMVEKAFQECDLNHGGRLSYEEFKMWLTRNPRIIEHIESILPYNGPKDMQKHVNKEETLPHMKRIARASLQRSDSRSFSTKEAVAEVAGDIFNHQTNAGARRGSISSRSQRASSMQSLVYQGDAANGASSMGQLQIPALSRDSSNGFTSPNLGARGRTPSFQGDNASAVDSEDQARQYLVMAFDTTQNEELKKKINALLESLPGGGVLDVQAVQSEVMHKVIAMEEYLWKKGKSFHMLSKRYYLLSGNCMYYYAKKSDVRPKGVIFLTGSLVERVKDDDMAAKGYYGFELLHQDMCTGEHHRHEKRVLYCVSQESRERWVVGLQHAAHVVPIEDEYVIGKELGRGRFSVVRECVHKVTNQHCAVKIIDKATIEKDEKELLRTEIAVLKLVNHPNIIRMEGLYESRNHIYIVMEMLKGGELFERIVGRPRFTEAECARLLRPLLESVAYLHDLGIVHRDLKPENILCGEDLDDLKIADFGLSKMIMPKERMDAACGTLSYVAPEVLTMQGYGKEADLWSVGVIMFLLLCGKLPFDGDDHQEIIRSTIQAELKVNAGVWNKLTDEARSLMTSLLNKNPKGRITAREALHHQFILAHYQSRRASLSLANVEAPSPMKHHAVSMKLPASNAATSALPRRGAASERTPHAEGGASSYSSTPSSSLLKQTIPEND